MPRQLPSAIVIGQSRVTNWSCISERKEREENIGQKDWRKHLKWKRTKGRKRRSK